MITYINQPFGIGDVIWCMTLTRLFHADSERIVWPVVPQYVEGLQRAYPDIEFCRHDISPCPVDVPIPYELGPIRVVPLRWSAELTGLHYERVMEAKYGMYGLDWRTWKDDAAWVRDTEREQRLFDLLNLPERFALVNETYQTDFAGRVPISVNGFPIVQMRPIDGFSLHDWAGVMERATEIHAVSSSSLYLFELLDIQCPIHLYPRANDPGFDHVRFLFTKPYQLHAAH